MQTSNTLQPGHPLLKFFYMLLVRGAILDGRTGCTYAMAMLQAIYEYFIVLKEREMGGQIPQLQGASR